MIITIDGPAGAGKSTIAKLAAQRLTEHAAGLSVKTFEYLDTGSMYRAVTLLGIRAGVDWNTPTQLERLTEKADINIVAGCTFLNGENITDAVRSPTVTEKIRAAADNPAIRQMMVEQQRNIAQTFLAKNKGLVTEGRDQGTVVFPEADCKFYLTASPEERTRRRLGELAQRNIIDVFDEQYRNEVYRQIMERDKRDASRPVGPLCEPADSHRIVSDGMTIEDVVNRMLDIVFGRSGG